MAVSLTYEIALWEAGAGTVATRRIRRYQGAGADLVVLAPEASADIQQQASHGDLVWHARDIAEADVDGAWLVLAATDDKDVNARVAQWAEERRIWCIDASDAKRGTARQAAMSMHGDVAIGVVSTGEPDPGRVRAVRDALGAHLDAGILDVRRQRPGTGRVILVGSGPGDPGLITVRGRQALSHADVVVTDRLGATSLLAALPLEVEVINVGKSPDNHPIPQEDINQLLVDLAREGKTVVRLKGGDPFVFGRGGEEVHACLEAGVEVEVVPGVTSALSVPALAGIPVTQRSVANSVVISSGHVGADATALAAMTHGGTVVFLMAVSSLPEIVASAIAAGADPTTPVAVIERGSTSHERITRGVLGTIVRICDETAVKPPAIIVIGEVAREGFLESESSATS